MTVIDKIGALMRKQVRHEVKLELLRSEERLSQRLKGEELA